MGEESNLVDKTQRYISGQWTGLNYSVDSYFSNTDYKKQENKSHILAYAGAYKAESKTPEYNYDILIKVHLPKTSKRIKFVFEREREDIDRSMNSEAENMRREYTKNGGRKEYTSYIAGLSYSLLKSKFFETNFDIGFKILLPVNPYSKLYFQKKITGKYLDVLISQGFILYRQEGFREVSQISFDKKLSNVFAINQANSLAWSDEDDTFEVRNALALDQKISSRKSLSYGVGASASLSPTYYYYNYDTSVSYRQLVHKDWLFGNLITGFNFPKEQNFQREWFIGGKVEVFFK